MESIQLIRYKYQKGAYSINDMLRFLRQDIITEDQFFDITRKYPNKKQDCN